MEQLEGSVAAAVVIRDGSAVLWSPTVASRDRRFAEPRALTGAYRRSARSAPPVRENAAILGDLIHDFDFMQAPRPPVLLPTRPKTTLTR